MSDFNSSLPIRTENDGDAVVKIADATTPSQQLKVEADGSINVNATATDLDIRDLVFATDKVDVSGSEVSLDAATLAALENTTVTVDNAAGAAAVNIQDGGNSITVDATDLDIRDLAFATDSVDVSGSEVSLDAATLAALENTTVTVDNAAGAAAVNIQDGGNSITVDATDLDIRDLTHVSDSVKVGDGTDFLAVNTDGSINVVVVDGTPGTPINSYNTAAAIAGGATSNHDYTVTALKTFYLNQIEASGTGKMKIEVLVNGVSKFVQFNSTANTNMSIHLENPITAAAGQVVRIIRTNRENQAQDLYSTISGYELP